MSSKNHVSERIGLGKWQTKWGEPKKPHCITVTDTAWETIRQESQLTGVPIGELIERYCRSLSPSKKQERDIRRVEDYLVQFKGKGLITVESIQDNTGVHAKKIAGVLLSKNRLNEIDFITRVFCPEGHLIKNDTFYCDSCDYQYNEKLCQIINYVKVNK